MKAFFFIVFVSISFCGFAQNNHIVKTEDGRRVLLKADFTWEYIDALKEENIAVPKKGATLKAPNSCVPTPNFKEPKLNAKIQSQLKKGRATLKHIKKKVANEHHCTVDQVLLIAASETKQNGVYDFCVAGVKVRYKRVGNAIIKPLFDKN